MEIGVAYYPEHWPRERWESDFDLMKRAGITLVRMGEFAWCRMEPRENEFDFAWLDEAVKLAASRGIRSVLCTPTQAPPPWLAVNYPETRPWTRQGQPYAIGARRHVDAASPAFEFFSQRITRALGEHYGRNRNVAGWQLDNEIGAHTHFVSTAPWVAPKFRQWLRRRYGTVQKLNEAWGLVFWSGEVQEWSEVEIQTVAPVGMNPAYRKDLRDFGQELWMDFLAGQAAILRPLCPGQFITHNIAWYGEQIDVWRLGRFLDVAGIDCYQGRPELHSALADLYQAAAGREGWAVLEMPANAGRYASTTEAGPAHGRLTATLVRHAMGGAKFASLFRFMSSPSGCEQWDIQGGLRDPVERPTGSIEECAQAKRIIARLSKVLRRPRSADIAIVHDTDDLIHSEMDVIEGARGRTMFNDYPRELHEIHHQLAKRGHRPTFTSLAHDWSKFRMVIVWDKLTMRPEQALAIRRYVQRGGTVVGNFCMGYLNPAGRRLCQIMPWQLTDVFGCAVRDILHVQSGMAPRIRAGEKLIEAANHGTTLEPLGGKVLAQWEGWTGEHRSAIVVNRFGKGRAIYIGALLDRTAWETVMPLVMEQAGIGVDQPIGEHPQLECVPERGCWVAYNDGHDAISVPVRGKFRDLVSGKIVKDQLALSGFGLAVLEKA